jgi:hypothetical protein
MSILDGLLPVIAGLLLRSVTQPVHKVLAILTYQPQPSLCGPHICPCSF